MPITFPMRLGLVPSGSLCLCPATDRCLPAHAALCSDHAAAGSACHRHRGPAAQAGTAQAHGPVRSPLARASHTPALPCPQPLQQGNVRGSLGSQLLTLSPFPVGIPGSHQIVLLPSLCYLFSRIPQLQSTRVLFPTRVSGFRDRLLLISKSQMCC